MNYGLDSHSEDRHKEKMTFRLNQLGQLSKKHHFLQYIFFTFIFHVVTRLSQLKS